MVAPHVGERVQWIPTSPGGTCCCSSRVAEQHEMEHAGSPGSGKGAGSISVGSPEPGLTLSGHGPADSKPCGQAPVQTTTKMLWPLTNAPGLSFLTGDGRRECCHGSEGLGVDGGNQMIASRHQVHTWLMPTHRMQRVSRDGACWGSTGCTGRAAAPFPGSSEVPEP